MANKRQEHKEKALVRMLTYALSINPAEFGILPDSEGWYPLKELVKALGQQEGFKHVRETMIKDAAARLAPDKLEVSGKLVRALEKTPPRPVYGEDPPAHLHLGVKRKAWPVIKKKGLNPREGDRIILAADREEALLLGKRRDTEPVMITVQAHQAMDQGVVFALWGESLYLADWLPAKCLTGPAVEENLPVKKPAKPKPEKSLMPEPDAMPGSFLIAQDEMEKPYKKKGLKKEISWKNERKKANRRKKAN
ncbi:RNA 2'-phosphotransferase [Dethiosulfatarculus sandiegensis]|uniref:RNA 2'-phosphotransferase n=1 Tax=Dethiosulfatarculus sandiegensis TaxID=1429043 RepID=A0A0D2GFZ0_9BACT|nr:RNA 2'-phosphotransferase [Dethiosulfatarculus sandiegensis]KIX13842.1 hypothetical protein X474_11210 [Dethiosulfatarculus sandiegensis]